MGLRPWVSSEVYEEGVRLMLGDAAVNAEKDLIEGAYKEEQCIWGLMINTNLGRAFLPERRILRGAYLLADNEFDPGEKKLTLKQLQQFRGITTGWATVVPALRNELKAADVFLTVGEGTAVVKPKIFGYGAKEHEVERSWEDLWELFTACRWLAARTETWALKFGASLPELLPPRERLSLLGAWEKVVYVSSDATTAVVGAVDWTNGKAARSTMAELRPWLEGALAGEDAEDEDARIHLAEMLSVVGFACEMGAAWQGQVVLYAGDNKVVRSWIERRQSGSRAGRLLVRVLNMCEMRYRFQLVAGWWRTYHNVTADYITRCDREDFEAHLSRQGWAEVRLDGMVRQAMVDSEKFGLCLLPWTDEEDRAVMMQLRELRMRRQVADPIQVDWSGCCVVEIAAEGRVVRDFQSVANACKCPKHPEESARGLPVVVAGTVGADVKGHHIRKVLHAAEHFEARVTVIEGPKHAGWDPGQQWAMRQGWTGHMLEFVSTELGEVLARRRTVLVAAREKFELEDFTQYLSRSPVVLVSKIGHAKAEELCWKVPTRLQPSPGVPRDPLLPQVVAHCWWDKEGERCNVHGLGGPGRWPLKAKEGPGLEALWVYDRYGPLGAVRSLSGEEVWRCQGRERKQLHRLCEQFNLTPEEVAAHGSRATGGCVAQSLLFAAVALCQALQVKETKVGAVRDGPEDESLARLLIWLRLWRRGELQRGRAGGAGHLVWRWGEALWVCVLDENLEDAKAGGRRPSSAAAKAEAEKVLGTAGREQKLPFDGKVAVRV